MESQITTIGTILLGAFYAIGYLLNRRIGADNRVQKTPGSFDPGSADFMLSLTSATSWNNSNRRIGR